jgi:hypothetical protein
MPKRVAGQQLADKVERTDIGMRVNPMSTSPVTYADR